MSKKKKSGKKIAVGVIVGVLATTAIVCATVPQVRNIFKRFINKVKGGQNGEKTPEEQQEIDKRKEDENKLKEEINNETPDKDPDDIVIPVVPTKEDGATDEEIAIAQKKAEEAKQEKEYWKTTKTLKENIENCIKNQVQARLQKGEDLGSIENEQKNFVSVRRINNIYVYDENSILVDCDYLFNDVYLDTTNLSQTNAFLILRNFEEKVNINNMDELINFINNDNVQAVVETTNINNNSNHLEEFYKNHVMTFAFQNYIDSGYNVSLVNITCNNAIGESPTSVKCITKVESEKEKFYIFNHINSSMETNNMNSEEWAKFASTLGSDNEKIFITSSERWDALNFDWKALSEEYSGQKTQEAQAQAIIDSFSTFDENGDLETFDYPAYQEYKKQKEAEKEAKELEQNMTQEAKVTYTEQELGF